MSRHGVGNFSRRIRLSVLGYFIEIFVDKKGWKPATVGEINYKILWRA